MNVTLNHFSFSDNISLLKKGEGMNFRQLMTLNQRLDMRWRFTSDT